MSELYRWSPLLPDGSVRQLKYSFGPGTANALAVALEPARWLVVCPPRGAPREVFAELDAEGEVVALLAPNAYHHLGHAEWRQRYSSAKSYAPAGALSRLVKKSDVDFEPSDALSLPSRVRLFAPEGQKSPDLLISIASASSRLWWLGDLFSNQSRDDSILPLRLLSRVLGGGLGYRCNTWPELAYVDDRGAWRRSVRNELAHEPPDIVVPAHGDPVSSDTARRTLDLLGALKIAP